MEILKKAKSDPQLEEVIPEEGKPQEEKKVVKYDFLIGESEKTESDNGPADKKGTFQLFNSILTKSTALGKRSGSTDPSVIGKTIVIKGEISGGEACEIHGRIEGDVYLLDALSIGETGSVKGNVKAQNIQISGTIEGNIDATNGIEITETGSVQGDLVTPSIAVREGAVLQSNLAMSKPLIEEYRSKAKVLEMKKNLMD